MKKLEGEKVGIVDLDMEAWRSYVDSSGLISSLCSLD